ncbi:HSF-27 protein [Aphelenchoides avenae]|nr:HSF-27 protein [Aphelenchus avenae]KAH7721948.1 HSF-27 protein [Aphelenchus avenae]
MDNVAIDIHSNKLLDWLISRRQCSKDWQKSVATIREKISHAIQDMPENEAIVELLQGSYINYFHCKEIVEILKETEADTKNIFGYYSSQRMKDWQEILSLYEKDSVYLAESAQYLQRLVQYEIPGLRKQVAKCEQNTGEFERKERDYARQATDSRRNYENELAKMGLKGENIRKELINLAAGLPEFLAEITTHIAKLADPVAYYAEFRKYTDPSAADEQFLPLVNLLIGRGRDITVYEWKHGKEPTSVERPTLAYDEPQGNGKENGGDTNGDDIDFGDEDAIDFGDDVDLDIVVVGDEKGVADDGVARGDEALTLLESRDTRALIVAELDELLSFLSFRNIDDMSSSASDVYLAAITVRPEAVAKVKTNDIEQWIGAVSSIISAVTDSQKTHLFKIRSSPQYVEELAAQLEQKRLLEQRYHRLEALMVEKQKAAVDEARKKQEYADMLADNARTLHAQVESEISSRYNNREVNIMGEISAVLYS